MSQRVVRVELLGLERQGPQQDHQGQELAPSIVLEVHGFRIHGSVKVRGQGVGSVGDFANASKSASQADRRGLRPHFVPLGKGDYRG